MHYQGNWDAFLFTSISIIETRVSTKQSFQRAAVTEPNARARAEEKQARVLNVQRHTRARRAGTREKYAFAGCK